MEFEWDDAKSEACFDRRGFDFAHAIKAFFDPNRVVQADARRDYGEERYQLFGRVDGRLYVIVYTLRRSVIRIISARKANLREISRHENSTHQD